MVSSADSKVRTTLYNLIMSIRRFSWVLFQWITSCNTMSATTPIWTWWFLFSRETSSVHRMAITDNKKGYEHLKMAIYQQNCKFTTILYSKTEYGSRIRFCNLAFLSQAGTTQTLHYHPLIQVPFYCPIPIHNLWLISHMDSNFVQHNKQHHMKVLLVQEHSFEWSHFGMLSRFKS